MSLPTLVRSYTALDSADLLSTDIPNQIVQGFDSGEWRLVLVVKELGEVLTSENDSLRSKGVSLLASVVQKMDKSKLDRQSTKTLTTFFIDKLSDNSSLSYCLTGLTGLTESPAFGSGEGMEVARGLFAFVKPSSHPQTLRFLVYSLIDALLSRARPALLRMGNEFVKGYCALVEGEKDPRNLILSFGIINVLLLEFDITDCVEDVFDVTFCYFPITFTPPPDDPYGISSEDLVLSLRSCLAATSLFGPLALPLFLDKMQAASEKSKRQTLAALEVCFPIYGGAVSGEWASRFAEALTVEVFHATDASMGELALKTLTALFATLYPDGPHVHQLTHEADADGDVDMGESAKVNGVALGVVKNSLDELREPDKSNAKPAVQVVVALIAASHRLARYTLAQVLPQLLAIFKDPDEAALKPSILLHLSTILAALAPAATSPSVGLVHSGGQSPLEPFRDDLLTGFTSSSRQAATKSAALPGLVHLVQVPAFLSAEEVSYCVSALNDVLVAPAGEDEYDSALDGLVQIAGLHPRAVEQTTLPLLFAFLPGGEAPEKGSKESEAYRRALGALAELCTHRDLFEILALRILARLEAVLSLPAKEGEEFNGLYAHHLLATIGAVIKVKISQKHDDLSKYMDRFVPRLLAAFILPTTQDTMQGHKSVAQDPRLLADAGAVVNLLVQRLSVEQQTAFSVALNAAFHEGALEPLLREQSKWAGSVAFQPFGEQSSTAQKDAVVLFANSLLAMDKAVSAVPAEQLHAFLKDILARLTSTAARPTQSQLTATLHLLGSTVNKRAPDLGPFLDADLPKFWTDAVENGALPAGVRRTAIKVWAWVSKALVVRSEQKGYAMVDRLLSLFTSPDLGLAKEAARCLGVVVDETDSVLSKENAAVVRLLYKQRFFAFLLPKLVEGHKEAEGKAVYLIALSSLLKHIPKQMTVAELPKLLPLLTIALDLADPSLRANVIECLALLAREVPSQTSQSIDALLSKVLRILTEQVTSREHVQLRLAALDFLAALPETMPWSELQGRKAEVIKSLGEVVDDRRREVRRRAVECRGRWFGWSS